MNCSEFLDGFSDYLDGVGEPAARDAIEGHLAACASCRAYERAYRQGRSLLASFPEVEINEDFHPRLQHRIYHLEDEEALARGAGSATSAAAILGIAIILAVAAWSPLIRPEEPLVELSPIVVSQPGARVFGLRPAPVSLATLVGLRLSTGERASLDLWEGSHRLLYEHSALSARYRQTSVLRAGLQ